MTEPTDRNEQERIRCMALSKEHGDFVRGEDGYYVYWPEPSSVKGFLAAHHLRWLADELDRMNAAWDAQMQNDLETRLRRARNE